MKKFFIFSVLLTMACSAAAHAEIIVQDDAGQTLRLPQTPRRIVSLAPHATELLFAAGAGAQIVGISKHSDYPEAARRLPQVGGANPDLERMAALRPDLIVAWPDGMGAAQLQRLRRLQVPLYHSAPRRLDDIPAALERMAAFSANPAQARAAAAQFRQELQSLRKTYGAQPKLRVFYQIWDTPLLTLNGQHIVSDAIASCGGVNVFAQLPALTPHVGLEDVLRADPDVILSPSQEGRPAPWLENWQRWPRLKAVRQARIFNIPADLIDRPGPRMIEGVKILCAILTGT